MDNHRAVLVWLPPDYAAEQRDYPVIYMHDGQNLFDAYTGYSGEWQIDETMTTLSAEGLPAIIVGLPNQGEMRRIEYSPYTHDHPGMVAAVGRGADYIRFIVETVKPLIDRTFRTRPDVSATGIAGSSMGGLISLFGFLTHPDAFGFCGAFSPAYWIGNEALLRDVERLGDGHGKLYVDIGGLEGSVLSNLLPKQQAEQDPAFGNPHNAYVGGVQRLIKALRAHGYVDGQSLQYVEEPNAEHNEAAWARRAPDALRFLLKG
jgi:predicted alpha/beta superfamily hydrolase